ncbi:MAG: hypothetical protein AB1405_16835 [Bdellovibrionota bacterium]
MLFVELDPNTQVTKALQVIMGVLVVNFFIVDALLESDSPKYRKLVKKLEDFSRRTKETQPGSWNFAAADFLLGMLRGETVVPPWAKDLGPEEAN